MENSHSLNWRQPSHDTELGIRPSSRAITHQILHLTFHSFNLQSIQGPLHLWTPLHPSLLYTQSLLLLLTFLHVMPVTQLLLLTHYANHLLWTVTIYNTPTLPYRLQCLNSDYEGRKLLWKVVTFLPVDIASYPRRLQSSLVPPWKPQIMLCEEILLISTLTLRRLMSYIYGAPILDVSRSHTTTQHSR